MTLPDFLRNLHPLITENCLLALRPSKDVQSQFSDNPEQFLSSREKKVWTAITNPAYRRDWFAGRMLVKELFGGLETNSVSNVSQCERFRRYEILSRNLDGQGIRPRLTVDGVLSDRMISISHAGHMICVGIGLSAETKFGLDITPLGSVTPAVIRSFFSDREKELLAEVPEYCYADQLWSAKEAAYKALCETEPFMPRLFQPISRDGGFFTYAYHYRNKEKRTLVFSGRFESLAYAIAMVFGENCPEIAMETSNGHQAVLE